MVISGVYDYSSPEVQEGLERLILQLENTTYIDPFYTESWLREFLDYVRRNKDYSPIDISNEASFIEALNSVSIDFRGLSSMGSWFLGTHQFLDTYRIGD